ncbi:poly(U)-specific 3'-to-5' RNA exonuclease [Podila minutissima]|uniref:U6 snRNA phosphodiesterase 1 n=1 Tax=Podila minutissima TaxID=64525 RepID=A0A9P5SNY4_9FUNG|nr:poly(U)-specific 3'-to-5' RNA exonuclease [Podila minutissima]
MSLVHYTSSSDEEEDEEKVLYDMTPAKSDAVGKRALDSDESTTAPTNSGTKRYLILRYSVVIKLSEEMFDIVSSFTESARKLVPKTISMLQSIQAARADPKATPIEAKSAEDATELHISLTRPIYLQALHIGRFVADVREAFKGKKRFNVSFAGLQAFSNDDKTRSFLSLRIGSGHSELERLLADMDEIVERYAQPKFYEEPEFHASFAWAVGGDSLTKEVADSVEEAEEELGNDLRQCSVLVRRVAWKTGQKVGSVDMMGE